MVRVRGLSGSVPLGGGFSEASRRRSSLALTLNRIFGLELRLTVAVGVTTGVGQPRLNARNQLSGRAAPLRPARGAVIHRTITVLKVEGCGI
jgi:hypothetical protein